MHIPFIGHRPSSGPATGRTMILVHGAFVGGWCWDATARYFTERGWRCLQPTLRHHQPGAAPLALAATGISDYVDDLAALAASLDTPPVLVGHSMGGLLCQMLAARRLASALVLLAPAAPWGILPSSQTEIEARFGLLATGAFWQRALEQQFSIAAHYALNKLSRPEQRAVFAQFVPESGRAVFETLFWHLDWTQSSTVRASAVKCPMLCLVGDEDQVISPATVRSIARRYHGQAVFHTLPGHSHFLLGEPGFDQVLARCGDWLERVLGDAAPQALQPAMAAIGQPA